MPQPTEQREGAAAVALVLERAADRLSKPGAWTQVHLARDVNGVPVKPGDYRATCWCISGALLREAPSRPLMDYPTLDAAIGMYPSWNDAPERTQSEVVAKLREAAAAARGRA